MVGAKYILERDRKLIELSVGKKYHVKTLFVISFEDAIKLDKLLQKEIKKGLKDNLTSPKEIENGN